MPDPEFERVVGQHAAAAGMLGAIRLEALPRILACGTLEAAKLEAQAIIDVIDNNVKSGEIKIPN